MKNDEIKFVHFYGTQLDWQDRMDANLYDKSVVFAKIWNLDEEAWSYVVYAGKDKDGNEYKYDMCSIERLKELERQLGDLQDLVEIDEAGNFVNENFTEAIDNFLNTGSVVIQELRDAIADISINVTNVSTLLHETINWLDENYEWIEE